MLKKRPRDFIETLGKRKITAGVGAPVFSPSMGGYGNGYTSRAITRSANAIHTGDLKTEAPQWYSPLLSFINYYIPWDLGTLNQYCRYFDTFHPLVGNCFVEGTKVNMADGTVKNIEKVEIDDIVLNHLSQPRKVTETFNPEYEGEIFELKIMGVGKIKVTGEHSFPVIRKEEFNCKFKNYKDKNGKTRESPSKCYFGESECCKYHECSSHDFKIEKLTVENIKPGDYLITTINDFVAENDLKIEHAKLLGYYTAEGFVDKYNRYDRPDKKYGKDEKVECEICGKEFFQLGSHICFKHGIKGDEYLKRFPSSKLVSGQEGKRIHERAKKKWREKEYSEKLHKHLKDLNGSDVGNDKVIWCLYHSEVEYIEEVYSCLDVLGLSYTKNYEQVAVSSTDLANLCLKHVGSGASTKKLSEDILYAPLSFQKEFLLSYLKGDGHFGEDKVSYVTVSVDLGWQIKFIAERLGIPVSLREIVPSEGNRNDGWNIVGKHNRWRGEMSRWAFDKVYGEKHEKNSTQSLIRRSIFVDKENKKIYRKIFSIEKESFNGVVYNIEVENEHTYTVQGVECFNCLSLHTELPLSRFGIKGVTDEKVYQFYEEMLEQMNALMIMYDQLREYWLIGEVFTYLYWDDHEGWWTDAALLQPEYVDILGSPIMGGDKDYTYKLRVGESIKELFTSGEEGESLKDKLPQNIIEAMEAGEALELDPFNLMIMQRKSPYAVRGSSIVLRALIDLIYETRLREAQMAVAERHIAPKEIWRVGSETFFPTQEYLESISDLILSGSQQPDFKIVMPNVVNYEVVGSTGKFPNIFADLQQIEERILTALFCYDEQTEVLTDNGFKFYDEVDEDDKIACFDVDTEELVYHTPLQSRKWEYEGRMYQFDGQKLDICVTPEHRMLLVEPEIKSREDIYNRRKVYEEIKDNTEFVKCEICGKEYRMLNSGHLRNKHGITPEKYMEKYPNASLLAPMTRKKMSISGAKRFNGYEKYDPLSCSKKHVESVKYKGQNKWEWKVVHAEDVVEKSRFRNVVEWKGDDSIKDVTIDGYNVSIEDYLKLSAWYLSEGWLEHRKENYETIKDVRTVSIAQKKYWKYLKSFIECLPFDNSICIMKHGCHEVSLKNGELARKFQQDFGEGCRNKSIPGWIKNLSKELLQVFLDELIKGDGSKYKNYSGETDKSYYTYATTSRKFADDVQEIALKCGFAPSVGKYGDDETFVYVVRWSDSAFNRFPIVQKKTRKEFEYKGYVWCFEVPTHFFVTRRNGKIAIQGNTSKAFTSGVGPTYNNASIGARVLLSRYIPVRQMLENAWKKNVFLPIAVEHDFYEIKQSELDHHIRRPYKDRTPIIPDFDWQYKANLLDDTNYKNMAINLWDKGLISSKTLSSVFDLDYDFEVEQLLKEQGTVHDKLYQKMREKIFEDLKKAGVNVKKSDINETNMLIPPEFKKSGIINYTIPGKNIDSISNGHLLRKTRLATEKLKRKFGEKDIKQVEKLKANRKEKNINNKKGGIHDNS